MAHLIGIDVGTTTLKAVLLDAERGNLVDCASCGNVAHHPRPNWSEFYPEEMWDAVASCVLRLAERNRPLDVRAIAVASMGEAGVPIDPDGNYLYPIIAWYDPRTEKFDDFWQKLGAWHLFQITGLAIRHIFSINKIMWLRNHRPEVVRNMRKWLCVEDFIIWKMSGEFATDLTMASRTMAFDQRTRRWSSEILDLAGIDAGIFPEVYPSGKMVGGLTKAAASKMGLAEGIPVVTGGHDHLCAALASGLLRPGQVLDSSGTAQAILALAPTFQPSRELFRSAFTHYPHVVADQFVVQGGLPAAGGAIEWFARLLAGTVENVVPAEAYTALFAEAAAIPPGSEGVCCVTHLLGSGTPQNDPGSRGALLGLSLDHTRGHAFRGVIEALGYSLRENIEALETALGQGIDEVIAVGGANRAALTRQIKSDISGRTITAPQLEEAAATGAALLAGVGAGVYADALQAANSIELLRPSIVPDPKAQAAYDELYHGIYLRLHRSLKGLR